VRTTRFFLTIAIFAFVSCVSLIADVPHYFSYQGRLMDDAGNPLTDTVELDFGIYVEESATTLLWQEVHPSVSVVDGLFNVFLGSGNPMSDSIFDGSVLWLGIKVNDGQVMDPLTPFVASPYSFHSIHADTAEYALNAPAPTSIWSQSGNYIRLPDVGDSVGIGVLDPPYKFTVNGEIAVASGGESKYLINYDQGGLNIAEIGVQDRMIHLSDSGNVGIGTVGAEEKLHVAGNAKINDTIKVGAFEEDAINRHNIIDEVGLGYASYYTYWQSLTTDYTPYLTKEITVPTSGYVLAIADAGVILFHGSGTATGARVAVSDMPDRLNGSMYQQFFLAFNVSAGDYFGAVSCQRLFNVSAGTHTFYMIAKKVSERNTNIINEQMILLFIPTSYGSEGGVFTTEAGDNFNEQDMDRMYSELKGTMESDNSVVESASASDVIPLEEQIRSLNAQIEELRKRMEVYEGQ
jgi:hypothetical protein